MINPTPMTHTNWLSAQIEESIQVHQAIREMIPLLEEIAHQIVQTFQNNGRVFFCGNGGSAADAQHWAAEPSGRFFKDRPSLPAIALTVNTSEITAIGNDYGYEYVFSRPLSGLGQEGDLLVGISTSGNSANVVEAVKMAKHKQIKTVAFTGETGGKLRYLADWCVQMPSQNVARIQEGHELCGHLICGLVERLMFG